MAALAAGLVITCAPVAAETIRFGGILPLTGPGALIGTAEMRGVQFAVDQANAKGGIHGNQIEMLFEDNQAKPDQSILSFNKLTDLQHVPVIFTGYSGPSLAMAPLATRKKVLLVNAGAQADGLAKASPYLINTLPTIGGEIEVISRWAVRDGKKKAGILFENGAAGMAGRDDYLKSFAEAGGTVVAQEILAVRPDRFPPALLKIADAKPDVMLVVITAGLLQMAQEYKQLDLKFAVAGTTFFADPSTIADPASTGFVHTQLRIEAPPDLAAQFKAKYDADMEFFAKQYYNAAQIVLTTLDKVLAEKKPVTGEAMHDALFEIRRFQGLIPMEFKTNTASVPMDINVMRDGKDVLLKQMQAQ